MPQAIAVTPDNFRRAESDMYFSGIVKDGGFSKFNHIRAPMPIDHQSVIRANRDTLYSAAVFDLDAGPVTITLPEAGDRFMSLQVFDEDEYTQLVAYGAGKHTFTREKVGTRYMAIAVRTLVNPEDKADIAKVHKLQDAMKAEQPGGAGKFEPSMWDKASQDKVRGALLTLAATLPSLNGAFGSRGKVDPTHHLIACASAWGGNPETEAQYINVTPARNDGKVVYRLNVPADVPVDAFWSISVYNAKGYFEPNARNAYSLNNITAKKDADGSVTVQFGGDASKAPNTIPITPGWNYLVRLYRPRKEILEGKWKFPEAQPVQ
jgi:hypothetical protein